LALGRASATGPFGPFTTREPPVGTEFSAASTVPAGLADVVGGGFGAVVGVGVEVWPGLEVGSGLGRGDGVGVGVAVPVGFAKLLEADDGVAAALAGSTGELKTPDGAGVVGPAALVVGTVEARVLVFAADVHADTRAVPTIPAAPNMTARREQIAGSALGWTSGDCSSSAVAGMQRLLGGGALGRRHHHVRAIGPVRLAAGEAARPRVFEVWRTPLGAR